MRKVNDGFEPLSNAGALNFSYGVTAVTIDGRSIVYASDLFGDRVDIFGFDDDGVLTPQGSVGDTTISALNGVAGLASATVGANTYLLAAGGEDNGLTSFKLGRDGSLVRKDALFDDGTVELDNAFDIETVTLGRKMFALVSAFDDDGIQIVRVLETGKLDDTGSIDDTDAPSAELDGILDIETAVIDKRQFVFAAAYNDGGISVLDMQGDGTINFVTSQPDTASLALSGVRSLAVGQIATKTFLYAAGEEDAISVFKVSKQGVLNNVSNFLDTSTTEISDITQMEFVRIDRKNYLFAADHDNSSINVFQVAGNGSLTAVALLEDTTTTSLNNIYAFTFAELANGHTALITTGDNEGVSTFEIKPSDFDGRAGGFECLF